MLHASFRFDLGGKVVRKGKGCLLNTGHLTLAASTLIVFKTLIVTVTGQVGSVEVQVKVKVFNDISIQCCSNTLKGALHA